MDYWQILKIANDPSVVANHLDELLESIASDDESTMNAASEALEHCDPPPIESIETLSRFIHHGTGDQIYWACTLIGKIGPPANDSQRLLASVLDCVQANGASVEAAADSLGQIGPLSQETKRMLQAKRSSAGPRLQRLLAHALGID